MTANEPWRSDQWISSPPGSDSIVVRLGRHGVRATDEEVRAIPLEDTAGSLESRKLLDGNESFATVDDVEA